MDMPFEPTGLSGNNADVFIETCAALREQFGAESTGNIDFQLENFTAFSYYAEFKIQGSYAVNTSTNSCYLLFVETFFKTLSPKGSKIVHNDYQVWGLGYLKDDAGRVAIRPETLTDKLVEFVSAAELDFNNDKAFSNAFYVLADDRHKATKALTQGFRKTLLDIRKEDYTVEINEHTFIIGNRKAMSANEALRLASVVCKLVSSQ